MRQTRKKKRKIRKKKTKRIKYKRRKRIKYKRRKRGGNGWIPPHNSIQQQLKALETFLVNHGVSEDNISFWGQNGTKPLSALLKEIKSGETILVLNNNNVVRLVKVVSIRIFDSPAKTRVLKETGHYDQNMNKIRDRKNIGILEKMEPGEKPINAIIRGIHEELGNRYAHNLRFFKGNPTYNIDKPDIKLGSNSYPGLNGQYMFYKEEGYIPVLTQEKSVSPFYTIEQNNDGSFKRYIEWQWIPLNSIGKIKENS